MSLSYNALIEFMRERGVQAGSRERESVVSRQIISGTGQYAGRSKQAWVSVVPGQGKMTRMLNPLLVCPPIIFILVRVVKRRPVNFGGMIPTLEKIIGGWEKK